MASATKTLPQIAPGILCPKCGSAMLDERVNKRSDKSPDYTCSNMLCFSDASKKYRTAIWAKDAGGNGALPTQAAPAPAGGSSSSVGAPAGAEPKPTMRAAYKSLTEWVIKEIAPIYDNGKVGMSPESAAACVATLFIQACKSGKVE